MYLANISIPSRENAPLPTYRRASSTAGNGSQQHRWYTLSRTGCNAAQAISADTTPDPSNRTNTSLTRKPAFTFLGPQHIDRTGHPPSSPCRSPTVNHTSPTAIRPPAVHIRRPTGPHSPPEIERNPVARTSTSDACESYSEELDTGASPFGWQATVAVTMPVIGTAQR